MGKFVLGNKLLTVNRQTSEKHFYTAANIALIVAIGFSTFMWGRDR